MITGYITRAAATGRPAGVFGHQPPSRVIHEDGRATAVDLLHPPSVPIIDVLTHRPVESQLAVLRVIGERASAPFLRQVARQIIPIGRQPVAARVVLRQAGRRQRTQRVAVRGGHGAVAIAVIGVRLRPRDTVLAGARQTVQRVIRGGKAVEYSLLNIIRPESTGPQDITRQTCITWQLLCFCAGRRS